MATKARTANPGKAAEIRRYYERRMAPVAGVRARRDVLGLLEDRKALQRAAEALMHAAQPYTGDPKLKQAYEDFRAVIEGSA